MSMCVSAIGHIRARVHACVRVCNARMPCVHGGPLRRTPSAQLLSEDVRSESHDDGPLNAPLCTKWPAASSKVAQSSSIVWVSRPGCGPGMLLGCTAVGPMPALEMKVLLNLHAGRKGQELKARTPQDVLHKRFREKRHRTHPSRALGIDLEAVLAPTRSQLRTPRAICRSLAKIVARSCALSAQLRAPIFATGRIKRRSQLKCMCRTSSGVTALKFCSFTAARHLPTPLYGCHLIMRARSCSFSTVTPAGGSGSGSNGCCWTCVCPGMVW